MVQLAVRTAGRLPECIQVSPEQSVPFYAIEGSLSQYPQLPRIASACVRMLWYSLMFRVSSSSHPHSLVDSES